MERRGTAVVAARVGRYDTVPLWGVMRLVGFRSGAHVNRYGTTVGSSGSVTFAATGGCDAACVDARHLSSHDLDVIWHWRLACRLPYLTSSPVAGGAAASQVATGFGAAADCGLRRKQWDADGG